MSEHSKQTTNKIVKALDLPQDLFLGLANLSLCGNRELYISNHRGILSYGQEEMIILVKDYQIQIKGKSLCIVSYSKEELTIHGYIRSLEFL
ncbi:MAG: sporulation protein [Agathobacter sp.]|nr:sporulation protein [Agathobacter sp.]